MTFSPVSGPATVPQCCEMVGTAQLFSMLKCWAVRVAPISHSHLVHTKTASLKGFGSARCCTFKTCPSLFRSKSPIKSTCMMRQPTSHCHLECCVVSH